MRIVYLLPNFFTLGNIFCGFYAIVSALNGLSNPANADPYYLRAAYVIILAGFFDVFDGKIARITNSTSRFGVEFDSLADLVSFGVAPAVLMYLWALKPLGRVGWLAAFLFVVCGALRLARFNVLVGTISSEHFIGLPIPFGAWMLASTVIFRRHWFEKGSLLIAILVYVVAILMVSTIKYRSFKKVSIKGRNPYQATVVATIALIIIALKPQFTFFFMSIAYITFGLLEAIPGFDKLLAAFSRNKNASNEEK